MPRLSYNRAMEREDPKMDATYMPMPDHCGRGSQMEFDGVKRVDLIICHYYCTEPGTCGEYQQYVKDLKLQKKMRVIKRK